MKFGDGGPELAIPKERVPDAPSGARVILGFRPEHVHRSTVAPLADGHARVASTIELVQPTGSRTYATFRLGGQQAIAELRAHDVNRVGEPIEVDINLRRAVLFDPAYRKGSSKFAAMTSDKTPAPRLTRGEALRYRRRPIHPAADSAPAGSPWNSRTASCATCATAASKSCAASRFWCATRIGAPTRRISKTSTFRSEPNADSDEAGQAFQ